MKFLSFTWRFCTSDIENADQSSSRISISDGSSLTDQLTLVLCNKMSAVLPARAVCTLQSVWRRVKTVGRFGKCRKCIWHVMAALQKPEEPWLDPDDASPRPTNHQIIENPLG